MIPLSILFLLILLFLFLQPRTHAFLFPSSLSKDLDDFITESSQKGSIDAKKFWELREFYTISGSFEYAHDGLEKKNISQKIDELRIQIRDPQSIPFLAYSSSRLKSLELLTEKTRIDEVVDISKIPQSKILLKTHTDLIFKTDSNTVYCIFLKPQTQMKEANGFFDYNGHDREYLKGKQWLSLTMILP